MQVRTPICSKKQTKIHPKTLQNRAKVGPKSLTRASQEPSGARVSPKSARKRPKRGPKRPQGRPWGPTRASQEGPRPPKERPEGARGLARGTSGEAKSTPSRLQKRKKSNLRKVLRDSALPTFRALRPPPDRPQIGPKSPQVGPSSPNTALHGGHEGRPGRNVALCEGREGGQSTKRRPVRKGPGHELPLRRT